MKVFLFFVSLLFNISCYSQLKAIPNSKVPKLVIDSFKKNYKGVSTVSWFNDGIAYIATFDNKGKKYNVTINEKGLIVLTEFEISISELPEAIKKSNVKNYKDYRISKIFKIKNGDKFFYILNINKGNKRKEVYYDKSGNVIQEMIK